ncbi:hypothetical protein KFL_003440090 [Klebsormidium nitens]|uniref:Uncharacterized protein n=1 Tax=Klebsormidium nitens TaxID=105231 RepID=A0A1Y1IGP0_KLENI|nr:hypothetical protein KFL_003440090 [Klebsormidium nitens]|eukprot:GAQ87308.1 hypothetical protein KFL_003440090 [Klebsormidium nitens]
MGWRLKLPALRLALPGQLLTGFTLSTQPPASAFKAHDWSNSAIEEESGNRRLAGFVQSLEALKRQPKRRLCVRQEAVLHDARGRAREASEAALPGLRKRFARLGLGGNALARVLEYVQESAPIVIHFDPRQPFRNFSTVLEVFLSDTEYRNQFETNISKGHLGPSRDTWERTLFRGVYHRGDPPSPEVRTKYGALNLFQQPEGCAPAGYGSCYFTLCSGVRKRVTFTWGDSSTDAAQTPATCQHFAHVLQKFSDADVRSLVKRGPRTNGEAFLVEAQIHGPIDFRCDVKGVRYASAESADVRKQLEEWADKNWFAACFTDQKNY